MLQFVSALADEAMTAPATRAIRQTEILMGRTPSRRSQVRPRGVCSMGAQRLEPDRGDTGAVFRIRSLSFHDQRPDHRLQRLRAAAVARL